MFLMSNEGLFSVGKCFFYIVKHYVKAKKIKGNNDPEKNEKHENMLLL